ncbi:M50 family metallopeptidase [Bacillus sp. A301a_S52]|nr:M50 family metallopeptidase [Bacillus sp. A301a_S52]
MTSYLEVALWMFIIGCLSYLPVIGRYFKLFNTMIHETGHAVAAILTGGRVSSISLFANTGGLAITRHRSTFGRFLTLLAGYPFASLFSVLFLYALGQNWIMPSVLTLTAILVYNLIFWVRNLTGWVWIVSVLSVLYFLYANNYLQWLEWLLTIIGIMLLTQAFLSTWVLFTLTLNEKNETGDAGLLEELTKIASIIWSTLFLTQGVICFILGISIWLGYSPFSFVNWLIQLF